MLRITLFLIFISTSALAEYVSPVRNTCARAGRNPLAGASSLKELSSSCALLQNNSSVQVVELSRNVLSIIDGLKANADVTTLADDPTLNAAVVRLTDKLNETVVSDSDAPAGQMGSDIRSLARRFGSAEFRAANKEEFYSSVKNIIAQTSQGHRLISCFERPVDTKIKGFRVEFQTPASTAGAGASANLDYVPVPNDPLSRTELVMSIGTDVDPVSAISMIAHEMQHACNADTVCNHERSCRQSNDQRCLPYSHAIMTDELVAHNLEADIFNELAQSSPGIMCTRGFVSGATASVRTLADHLAEAQEGYHNGTLLNTLAPRYLEAGLWNYQDVYVETNGEDNYNPALLQAIRSVGIPDQRP